MKFWHRVYDPETGRYISADPIGLRGGMNVYAYVGGNPVNAVDPLGLARYKVVFHTRSWGAGIGTFYYKVSGIVIALDRNPYPDCNYDAVRFEGKLSGIGTGLPFSYTDNNSEIFDDHIPGPPDVTRVEGRASILAGTNTISNWSGGYYRFGLLEGSNKNVAGASGFDIGVDFLGGRTWTTSEVFQVESPNNF